MDIPAYRATTDEQFRHNQQRGTFFSPEATPEFGDHIYSADLHFDNPLAVQDGAEAARQLGDEKLAAEYEDVLSGWDSKKDAPLEEPAEAFDEADRKLAALARKAGHDGIVFREHDDLNPVQYVSLKPETVGKIDKVGKFDWKTATVQADKPAAGGQAVGDDFTHDPQHFVSEDLPAAGSRQPRPLSRHDREGQGSR